MAFRRASILQTPFLSGAALRPVWERRRGVTPSDEPETAFPTQARLPSVHVPMLVIHGTADSVIPLEQGKAVYERIASRRKRFVPVEGADHCNFQYFLGEKYVSLLVGFLRRSDCRLFSPLAWIAHWLNC